MEAEVSVMSYFISGEVLDNGLMTTYSENSNAQKRFMLSKT
jgi:hypothetical protein